jgi:hypothetical protein
MSAVPAVGNVAMLAILHLFVLAMFVFVIVLTHTFSYVLLFSPIHRAIPITPNA